METIQNIESSLELNPTQLAMKELAWLRVDVDNDKFLISQNFEEDDNKELINNALGYTQILDKHLVA